MCAGSPLTTTASRPALRLVIDLDRLVDDVATRVAVELAKPMASQQSTSWMSMGKAINYTRIPPGTFRK